MAKPTFEICTRTAKVIGLLKRLSDIQEEVQKDIMPTPDEEHYFEEGCFSKVIEGYHRYENELFEVLKGSIATSLYTSDYTMI